MIVSQSSAVSIGKTDTVPSPSETVRRYIASQEAHHRKLTFQEEFLALLKAHEIEYDPRHIWK